MLKHGGSEDDAFLKLAFDPAMSNERKKWLDKGLMDSKINNKVFSSDFIPNSQTQSMTFSDFFSTDYLQCHIDTAKQHMASGNDGLTKIQRKILATFFALSDGYQLTVSQLAGVVSKKMKYQSSETVIEDSIIKMCQNSVGTNNLNLLTPVGQFGSRNNNRNVTADPRYIAATLSPLARLVYPEKDDLILKSQSDNFFGVEPESYSSIIPMILVNGSSRLCAGYKSIVPSYCPRILAVNIKRMILKQETLPLAPKYKGFQGSIQQVGKCVIIFGVAARLSETTFEITELPISTNTEKYKLEVLDRLRENGFISGYTENHTNESVRFVVKLPAESFQKALDNGFYFTFRLITFLHPSFIMLNQEGHLVTFDNPQEVCQDFYYQRQQLYKKRKQYYEEELQTKVTFFDNQIRFLQEINDNIIKLDNVNFEEVTKQLVTRHYDSDPIKLWSSLDKNGKSKVIFC